MTITADTNEKKVAEDASTFAAPSTAASTDDDDNASKASISTSKPLDSVTPTAARFFQLVHGETHLFVIGLVFLVVSEAANLAVPYIVALAYDALQDFFFGLGAMTSETEAAVAVDGESLEKETMKGINLWMIVTIAVYVFGVVAGFVSRGILGVLGERLVARLRNQLYDSVLHQEIGFYDEHKTGEIVSRLGSDTQLLQSTVATFAPETLIGSVKTIISLILMFSINAKLTSLTFAGIFLLCIMAIPFGQYLAVLSKRYQDILGDAQTRSTEALGGIRTVQSFAAEFKELNRFTEKIGDPDVPRKKDEPETTYTTGAKKALVQVGVFTLVFGGAFGFLYCTLWYAFYLVVVEGSLSLGLLTAFQSYVINIGFAIGTTITNGTQLLTGVAALGRVFYLLERKPLIKNFDGIYDDGDDEAEAEEVTKSDKLTEVRKSIIPSTAMEGVINFDNVMFSYPTRPDVLVLNAFTLKLPKDSTTALVGSSGSGKSTVVSLIQRFYDADAGAITLDGVDITHLDISWLRSQIGYVQQEPQLFGMTLRNNLTYGLPEEAASKITQVDLENVCRDANAHDFISSWPEGYDTMVGERGITLSGGQKQRIAIARALLTNCRILLLDEATSALDSESEFEVQKAIENAMVGRTVVVVAHRLSTIKGADQIVVMDNRKIVDVGTHDDLLENCQRYQDLIKRQNNMARDVSSATIENMVPANLK
jgi:ATP-binding cassette subfamily B protein